MKAMLLLSSSFYFDVSLYFFLRVGSVVHVCVCVCVCLYACACFISTAEFPSAVRSFHARGPEKRKFVLAFFVFVKFDHHPVPPPPHLTLHLTPPPAMARGGERRGGEAERRVEYENVARMIDSQQVVGHFIVFRSLRGTVNFFLERGN